jgi:hypothetical protein
MEERPLVLAVIDACLLLELCDDDEIDAERAVRAMDDMRAQLTALRHDDQVELRAQMAEIAADSPDEAYATLVADLPDRLGLAKPHADAHRSWR